MSFNTMAAARQYEIKASIAVVATNTLATGRADCENEGPWGFEDMSSYLLN
jgi:hypothetical protein